MTQKHNMTYFLQTESSENRSKCHRIPETPTCRKAIAEVQPHMERDAMAEEREDKLEELLTYDKLEEEIDAKTAAVN